MGPSIMITIFKSIFAIFPFTFKLFRKQSDIVLENLAATGCLSPNPEETQNPDLRSRVT
jgi:hypothetical protein